MRDDVDEFAASYGIVHDVTMWDHPHRAFRDGHVAWPGASRRHATPADTAGEPRRVGAEQVLSDNRMNAIGADDDVGLDLAAVGKARHRAAIACFNRDAASSEADVGRLERATQHVEQVGAVHRDVRRAELLAKRASTYARNNPPALPAADDQKIRLRPEGNACTPDAKPRERHRGVGPRVKAGPFFFRGG